jgi:hypothetical protein
MNTEIGLHKSIRIIHENHWCHILPTSKLNGMLEHGVNYQDFYQMSSTRYISIPCYAVGETYRGLITNVHIYDDMKLLLLVAN